MTPPILRAEGLRKTYGEGAGRVEALRGVDLEVRRGEFVSIVGASGSGKSTLLHLLGGLDIPDAGSIVVDGQTLGAQSDDDLALYRRRKVGFIFQSFNLVPILTLEENIALPAVLDRRGGYEEHLDEIIQVLGLQDRRKHLPSELSGGQQQRAAIGRALINKPALLLADEPTGNLDSRSSREAMDFLLAVARRFGQTVVLITHDSRVAATADRMLEIRDGELVAGSPPT